MYCELKCEICSAEPIMVKNPQVKDLVKMQEHAMQKHGITLEEIAGAKGMIRHGENSLVWILPNGTIYLKATLKG